MRRRRRRTIYQRGPHSLMEVRPHFPPTLLMRNDERRGLMRFRFHTISLSLVRPPPRIYPRLIRTHKAAAEN